MLERLILCRHLPNLLPTYVVLKTTVVYPSLSSILKHLDHLICSKIPLLFCHTTRSSSIIRCLILSIAYVCDLPTDLFCHGPSIHNTHPRKVISRYLLCVYELAMSQSQNNSTRSRSTSPPVAHEQTVHDVPSASTRAEMAQVSYA